MAYLTKLFVKAVMGDQKMWRWVGTDLEYFKFSLQICHLFTIAGRCMENLGVLAGDSRDSLGQGRFFPFKPETHVIKGEILLNNGLSLHSRLLP